MNPCPPTVLQGCSRRWLFGIQTAHDGEIGTKAVRSPQKVDLTVLLPKISQIYFRALEICADFRDALRFL
jgi:hypothetical protein